MAWIPSHQTLRDHPKTRKAARRLGVSLPTMIGHLHLLWYWALDLAPDGDVSRYDDDDLADAAGWEGDPSSFVVALLECGPGGGVGFITGARQLHDWEEYGGKYRRRSEAGKRAAAMRWHSDGNANVMGTQWVGNAEERRGEEKDHSVTDDPTPLALVAPASSAGADGDGFDDWWSNYPRKVAKAEARRAWRKALRKPGITASQLDLALDAQRRAWRTEGRQPDKIPHASTWLNGERWNDDALSAPAEAGPMNGWVER